MKDEGFLDEYACRRLILVIYLYRGNEQIEVGLVLILNSEEWLELELFS